ncbi:DUF4352 domain-containing protein [Listeria rocourtiae]|uniref:hypothetical protein n=1 Tax=Listeria rocourtiae TaxID=647910 RepID=UPI0016278559|nr:hypothetical protein [Listeria rocourtiae]MBC1605359.1 DUF4352 domain-containing protein [Listeria rocourtiae]
MKLVQVLILVVGTILLVGCGKINPEFTGDMNNAKKSGVLQITIEKVKVNTVNKDKEQLEVDYKIKNTSKEDEVGIIAQDFIIKNNSSDKEEYTYAAENLDNFNFMLKPNEEKSGKGFYNINKSMRKMDLMFRPIQSNIDTIIWEFER